MSAAGRRAAARATILCFSAACVGSLGFMVAYAWNASIQAMGAALGVAFAAIGFGIIAWSKYVMPQEEIVQERGALSSPPEVREAADAELAGGEEAIARDTAVVRIAAVAAGTCGAALIFPIRSLGPSIDGVLARTSWRPGSRAVTPNGMPLKSSDVVLGEVQVVFPEGHTEDPNASTMLIRLNPPDLLLPPERKSWAPDGLIGYSRICTHAGCPVGLYRQATQQLLCPCHQSTFDVLRGARVIFGPASRALPQLPLQVDASGYVRALGDFPEPVGPNYWEGRYTA